METIHKLSYLLFPISKHLKHPKNHRFPKNPTLGTAQNHKPTFISHSSHQNRAFHGSLITKKSRSANASAGWFPGFGQKKPVLPEIVKAGDPVLHEPARDVAIDDIGSDKIEKIIEDMVSVMRNAPGVGLAAPQIGIPLKIIVLEDTETYISYARKEETEAQDRHPFELLVILNPRLKKKGNKTALFFEGCLSAFAYDCHLMETSWPLSLSTFAYFIGGEGSVDGFRAVVERHLEVEVTGLGRDGQPIRIDASGWQARILQHECDHLNGIIYVDKLMPRTFRSLDNLDLPLPRGCPKLGGR